MKEILLKEYETLKNEQLTRIKHRDNIIYVLLGAVGTLFSFAIIHKAYHVVAIVPMVALVVCWLYIVNDKKISQIGNYIEHVISQKIQSTLTKEESEEKIFEWENWRRDEPNRKFQKWIQFNMDYIVFCMTGLIATLGLMIQSGITVMVLVDFLFVTVTIVLLTIHHMDTQITQEK